MKLRSALLFSFFAVTGVSTSVFAAATTPPAQEGQTELGEKMSEISKAFKKLRSQVADTTKNDESLMLVASIRENTFASLGLVPEKAADLPEADRARFKADFTSKMKSLLTEVDKLEAAFKSGNNEEAKSLLETLGNAQKEGHKEFRKKKPEKK